MLTAAERKIVAHQLRALTGQLDGLRALLDAPDTGLDALFQQFRAVEGGAHRAVVQVLDELFRKKLVLALVAAQDACPGECDYCDRVERLKKEFAGLDMPQVLSCLTEFVPGSQRTGICCIKPLLVPRILLVARSAPHSFVLAFAGAVSFLFHFPPIPMKRKLFALSAGALLFAGSVLAAGTNPHAATKPATRKSCPVTKDCPASLCQSDAKAPKTCTFRPGCCMK